LGRKQAKFVKETYGTGYQKKSWAKPLLIAFGCLAGFIILVVAFGFAAELIHGTEKA
jgi:hypothetical protein